MSPAKSLKNRLQRRQDSTNAPHIGLTLPTGEELVVRKRARTNRGYVKLFAGSLDAVLALALSRNALLLMMKLLAKYEADLPLMELKQSALAQELGINQSQVSRALKELRKAGILVVYDDGHEYLNVALFYKGRFEDLRDEDGGRLKQGQDVLRKMGIEDVLEIQ